MDIKSHNELEQKVQLISKSNKKRSFLLYDTWQEWKTLEKGTSMIAKSKLSLL